MAIFPYIYPPCWPRECRWSSRSWRSWRRCEYVGSTVVRAALSPTAVLLLLLVASLLTICFLLYWYGGIGGC